MGRKQFDVARYLQKHEASLARLEGLAQRMQSFIRTVLADSHLPVHLVAARAKTSESVREKIQRKSYRNPTRQLTDVIGLRVITYYRDDVDKVVDILRSKFKVHNSKSVDKRSALGLRSFGYRSVHLFASPKSRKLPLEYSEIRDVWCEIQVRSLLEHAWAEIEHEVVYKSGISYPKQFSRQFAALAGALEILDSEFLSLRAHRDTLIEGYREGYSGNRDGLKRLDAARLIALLECDYPEAMGWRKAAQLGHPFSAHSEASCVSALRAARILTAKSLRKILRGRLYGRLAREFAHDNQLSSNQISHFAIALIAIATRNPRLIPSYFPDVALDPAMAAVLEIAQKTR